ncbi:BTB/POZ domain-containing protein KCTD7-like [Ylistrum balloti]|uniref:BTB/POZ domain-containing protein KCTD7-like n=1 Tax=Ylistrum balloti TaxID=509963 RepID=UPI002905F27E|nr:BTB/POZ domain-containing protein KCTD7-like [Ylistrum balloti]
MTEETKFPSVIELNVGGRHFTTSLLTLIKSEGTMLAAMFSGNYDVKKDKNGRYFIDADGDTFVHVLNYLRYGELPPAQHVHSVYRDAVYFGLIGLTEELERYPSMLSKIQRDAYRTQFPGYQNALVKILDTVTDSNQKIIDTTSDIFIVLFAKVKKNKLPNFDKNHVCAYKPKNKENKHADVSLGPWDIPTPEKDVMNCITFDLKEQGFIVTHDMLGQCNYMCEKIPGTPGQLLVENCCYSMFKITFHWWKM